MQIKFECPHCGQRLSAANAEAGTGGQCPTCSENIIVPPPPIDAFANVLETDPHLHDQSLTTNERSTAQHQNAALNSSPGRFPAAKSVRNFVLCVSLLFVSLGIATFWFSFQKRTPPSPTVNPRWQEVTDKLDAKLKRAADQNGSRFLELQRTIEATEDGYFVASITFFEPDQSIIPDKECMAEQFIVTARFVTEWRLQQVIMRPVFIRNGVVTATRGDDIVDIGQGLSNRANSSAFMATGIEWSRMRELLRR